MIRVLVGAFLQKVALFLNTLRAQGPGITHITTIIQLIWVVTNVPRKANAEYQTTCVVAL